MVLIRDLPPAEHDRRLHFVPLLDELPGMPGLELKIVRIRRRVESDLLQLRRVLMLLLQLVLLGQVDNLAVSVVHNLQGANDRITRKYRRQSGHRSGVIGCYHNKGIENTVVIQCGSYPECVCPF